MTRLTEVVRRLRLGSMVLLTAVWVLLWGRPSWGTLVMGICVAAAVLLAFPMPRASSRVRIRPGAMLWLAVSFIGQLVSASVDVAWKAVRPRPVSHGRIAAIALHDTDDFRRTVVAELTSLVPGTVVIDLDARRGELVIHVLDTCDDARLAHEAELIHRRERLVALAFAGIHLDECKKHCSRADSAELLRGITEPGISADPEIRPGSTPQGGSDG